MQHPNKISQMQYINLKRYIFRDADRIGQISVHNFIFIKLIYR